jgi:hypothetical protein
MSKSKAKAKPTPKPKPKCKSKPKAKPKAKSAAKKGARPKIGGSLPPPTWLRTHGYSGLETAMRRHPEAFAHIPQDRKRKPSKQTN